MIVDACTRRVTRVLEGVRPHVQAIPSCTEQELQLSTSAQSVTTPSLPDRYPNEARNGCLPSIMKVSILSIDAWAEGSGWMWNAWYRIGEIDSDELSTLDSDEKILAWLASHDFVKPDLVVGKDVEIEDDQYNIVLCDPSAIDAPEDCDNDDCTEHTHCAMPVLAIAYGENQ